MAGDWIKMETCLFRKPEVFRLAALLQEDRYTVIGRLHGLWSWADEQSVDGRAVSATASALDAVVDCPGFADALRNVGWLLGQDYAFEFPNFDRHNGQTAKARALNTRRKGSERSKNPVAQMSRAQRDKSATREEKRREEKNNNNNPPTPLGGEVVAGGDGYTPAEAPGPNADIVAICRELETATGQNVGAFLKPNVQASINTTLKLFGRESVMEAIRQHTGKFTHWTYIEKILNAKRADGTSRQGKENKHAQNLAAWEARRCTQAKSQVG